MNLEKHNQHWKEGYFYRFELRRTLFNKLAKNIANRQIISVYGLRRTGKTVLMRELINFIIKETKVNRTHVLYYSFDEEQPKIEDLINEFEKLTGIDITKTRAYVFLDEIQKLEDWQDQLKYYYDNFNIKFFVSGSSSLFIRRKAKESLAGRSFDFYLPPLSFREFLLFKNKQELIEKSSLFSHEIEKEFNLYMKRQFIEVINADKEYIGEYVKSILEKVIFIDIPKVFTIEHQDLILRLLKIIASNPGMIVEYENLARELGINRTTLSNYAFYMDEAFLIKKLYNFSRNRLTSEKKSKKLYLNSTSFFQHLNPEISESKIIENLIIIETNAKFFWRTPFKDEVDVVLEDFNNKKIYPIEVKQSEAISNKDMAPLLKFCREFKLDEAAIITKNVEDEKVISKYGKKIKIRLMPAWKFLLDYF